MMEYVAANEGTDRFVNPDFPHNKRDNPWVESKKCSILWQGNFTRRGGTPRVHRTETGELENSENIL